MIGARLATAVKAAALAVFAIVVLSGPVLSSAAWAAPTFPALTGRVVDDAHILPAQTQQAITQKLAALEQANGDQVVVVTVPDLQGYEISDYGYQLGRAWGIGQKGKNNGALFIIAPKEHRVRIEAGYGLEPVLTDAMSSIIEQRDVLPRFKAGDYAGGVTAGVDDIIKQVSDPADQAAARAQAATVQIRPPHRHVNPIGGLVILFIVVIVFSSLFRRGGGGGGGLLPLIFLSSMMGGRGRDDDWGGGGGGGGGGFSGGGGSFGGGGSSGSW